MLLDEFKGEPVSTDREQEIAALIANGCTNSQVAERLYVSPHTVKGHLERIYAKLNIRSRDQLKLLPRHPAMVTS